eukprot:CAMPEP_0185751610 /NCGR_PEP_ID=MMETSP1174-20130828/10385_1 /TAXON_ID=35687 /ORGANISM="Dictyocha speculum, Strain CCMP1381" /LENGTH=456 /DNA_ID=CAMNT_0028428663 /DNA_START=84 /DNA_END=1454 /DNA_ORIENTATION=+
MAYEPEQFAEFHHYPPPTESNEITPAVKPEAGSAKVNGRNRLRKGKWTPEEEDYTARLIQCFNSGILILPEGTTLRSYLAAKLNCDPMRITKKFTGSETLGKRVYHPCKNVETSQSETAAMKYELGQLERRFQLRIERSNDAEASMIDFDRFFQGVNVVSSPAIDALILQSRGGKWSRLDEADLAAAISPLPQLVDSVQAAHDGRDTEYGTGLAYGDSAPQPPGYPQTQPPKYTAPFQFSGGNHLMGPAHSMTRCHNTTWTAENPGEDDSHKGQQHSRLAWSPNNRVRTVSTGTNNGGSMHQGPNVQVGMSRSLPSAASSCWTAESQERSRDSQSWSERPTFNSGDMRPLQPPSHCSRAAPAPAVSSTSTAVDSENPSVSAGCTAEQKEAGNLMLGFLNSLREPKRSRELKHALIDEAAPWQVLDGGEKPAKRPCNPDGYQQRHRDQNESGNDGIA